MKILREYVWDTLRQNKRSGAVIITALFLMTTLMSCFCGLVYTMWTDAVVLEKWHNGDWHGELFDDTPGDALEQIKNYASVSAVLIKGEWETAKLPDAADNNNPRLYLTFRGANQEYWDSMPEKNTITEGRIPASETEIALSKQYFEDYPDTKIGDTLTLPVGRRMYNGESCMDTDLYHEGETFAETGTKTYTIVGRMDVTTSSAVPSYTGMTWIDEASVKPEDSITVYLRFNPMRSTYQELPALAKNIGYETDEYGEYTLRYNTGLLPLYGIFAPSEKNGPISLGYLAVPLMFLLFAVLLVAVFVLVIHNAFIMSVNEKLSQLGTLAGVGATPGQIKKTVQTEALLLTAIPLPLGIFCGRLLVLKLFRLINASNDLGREAPDIVVTFGLPAILPAVLLSLLTAWLSARIPAGKAAKLLPVEILKQGGNPETLRKHRKREKRRFHFPGITGELAANAVFARRRSYRMATISLCLSFLMLTLFQYFVTIKKANDEIYSTPPSESGHIFLTVSDGRPPDTEALQAIKTLPEIKRASISNSMACAVWVGQEDASEDINTYLGGFDQIVAKGKYSPIHRDGKYRIDAVIYGLEDDKFREYCESLGVPPESYYDNPSSALVYNYTKDPENSSRRNILYRELLNLQEGQSLTFTEKTRDEIEGDYEFDIQIGKLIAREELLIESFETSSFCLTMFMPMQHVLKLADSCCERRKTSAQVISGIFWTADPPDYNHIQKTTKKMDALISRYYGSGDYYLSDLAEREEMTENMLHVMNLVITFLTAFLAVIGLSNVWASISGNLRQRRQEFAMLRSVGLSPKQLWKMLLFEGMTLGLKPLLYSLPLQFAVLAAMLTITEISVPEYLHYAPYGVILGYTALVLLAILGAYTIGGRKLQRENIIETIRDDTL